MAKTSNFFIQWTKIILLISCWDTCKEEGLSLTYQWNEFLSNFLWSKSYSTKNCKKFKKDLAKQFYLINMSLW